MDFLEIGIIIAVVFIAAAFLFYLIRYSNKRLLELVESTEQKLSMQEKLVRKNSRELQELKQIVERTAEGKKAARQTEVEKRAKEIEKKALEILSKS
ncbi:MAG: hypothetical protein J4478_03865 [Candidatus Diapherotrites archaeon]|uniref:Uncharacterized protein n=1 Tax=Candidatus Iainarchaeum sp. TaxID=3101447 RepID=A0A7J4KWZ1_9ARCH|nr:MAG: hypothetical protein QT12_C0019G0006 [archaeon GW2011_AR21]MBS3058509.1 hypothetical protein [Candidatus Diapherotrites archaeon]HIH21682.1 hypothetical protein [Candidatus Diapherotrites archaeon]HIH32955.1 hypothetical protein [Candidatus Diapherotrites archaeon]